MMVDKMVDEKVGTTDACLVDSMAVMRVASMVVMRVAS